MRMLLEEACLPEKARRRVAAHGVTTALTALTGAAWMAWGELDAERVGAWRSPPPPPCWAPPPRAPGTSSPAARLLRQLAASYSWLAAPSTRALAVVAEAAVAAVMTAEVD